MEPKAQFNSLNRRWRTAWMLLLLFVFYAHYLPAHLVMEMHCSHEAEKAHTEGSEHLKHCHDETHEAHSSLNHDTSFILQGQKAALTLDFYLSSEIFSFQPGFVLPSEVLDTAVFSDDSPPDPLQPRAPPAS